MFQQTSGFPITGRQSGMTLLEVLIALMVLSVGILGIASLQMVSLQSTTNSNLNTHAMMLTNDLMERIRANRDAILDNQGRPNLDNYGKAAEVGFPDVGDLVAACYTDTGCTENEMATNDLIQWSESLKQVLPVTTAELTKSAVICLDATPDTAACDGLGSAVKIAFSWSESTLLDRQNADPAATLQTYVTSFEP
ncbi:type IV pilus modification protein PilV [Allohahella marinimesophila]|uniref:Type IV pilin Tt1218-like domain-containing protein n=1 Tax=Allohahella marinimesophila TaxID=1054972 RepID=A0ABP7NNP6_9GAMM